MNWANDIREFFGAVISIFAIVNPVGNLPIFAGLTEELPKHTRRRVLRLAGVVAMSILVTMALLGNVLLDKVFHISMQHFMFAGGLMLSVVGIRNILTEVGKRRSNEASPAIDPETAAVNLAVSPLATPLLVGPGSIVTIMLIARNHGAIYGVAAALVAFVFVIAALNWAHRLMDVIGQIGSTAIGRIMQIFIVAIGVRFVFSALTQMFPQLSH